MVVRMVYTYVVVFHDGCSYKLFEQILKQKYWKEVGKYFCFNFKNCNVNVHSACVEIFNSHGDLLQCNWLLICPISHHPLYKQCLYQIIGNITRDFNSMVLHVYWVLFYILHNLCFMEYHPFNIYLLWFPFHLNCIDLYFRYLLMGCVVEIIYYLQLKS